MCLAMEAWPNMETKSKNAKKRSAKEPQHPVDAEPCRTRTVDVSGGVPSALDARVSDWTALLPNRKNARLNLYRFLWGLAFGVVLMAGVYVVMYSVCMEQVRQEKALYLEQERE